MRTDTLRILVAHPSSELYGSDRILLESVTGMLEAGWLVLVALPGPGPLVEALAARGARVSYCPSPVLRKDALRPAGFLRLVAQSARGLVAGLRLLARARPDVVYVNTLTVPLWLVLARLTGRGTLCHVHEAEGSAPMLVRRLLALPVLLAHRVLTNSEFSRGVLGAAFARLGARANVVYNGVAGPGSALLTPARARLEPPVRLVYVGRLSERKGPDLLLDAVAILAERGHDAHVALVGAVFAGNEDYERRMRARVRALGIEEQTRFLGFVPEVWPALARADIAVVPSRVDEPFGNTAVEAVLAGRPIVVSDTSGLREAAAHAGSAVRVRPDDAADLANGIEAIVTDWPRYRRLAVEATRVYGERFSVEAYRRAVQMCVEDLVGDRARR